MGFGVKRFGGPNRFGGGGRTTIRGGGGGGTNSRPPRLPRGRMTGAGTMVVPGRNVAPPAGTHLRLSASGFCPDGQHCPPAVACAARQHEPFGSFT